MKNDKEVYTEQQGQYLSFIYYYLKVNKKPPSFLDFEVYFETSSASVNSMLKMLEVKGFIFREKGKARSIKLCLDRDQIPDLK